MKRYSGKVVVITGAAKGIGRACAERFAREAASVVLGDNDEATLAKTLEQLEGVGRLDSCVCDVTRLGDVTRLIETALARFGRLDVMINNAGIAITKDFMSVTEEDLDRTLAVNLKGALFGVQAAARQMITQKQGGVIINMSSINSRLANPSVATYALSKGALNQLTGTAAVALAPYGIRVVGIGPGTILTDMTTGGYWSGEEARRSILSRTPLGRLGDATEIAGVAAFLASEDASYVTGQTIYPDGGRLILNYTVPVPGT
jgi:NAD(P)-dependent dehydrogenase (short-subunit alcohol dehydrogenase family)